MRFLAVFFLCLLPAVVNAQEAAKRKPAPTIDAVNETMQRFVDDGTISGAVTLVGHRGKVIHLGAVGVSDIETQRAMKTSDLFSIASMTKPIVATAIAILQDEGKLDFDDPVSKYLPAFADVKLRDGTAPERPITIRDCVSHTAGFDGAQIFEGSLKNAVDTLAQRPLAFSPGERWQYSPGLNVAGRIVEVVSEESLDEFLKQRIFDPLQMKQATFFPNGRQRKRIPTLYGKGDKLQPAQSFLGDYSNIEAPNPSGGLFANASSMFRFYRMILNQGKHRKQQIVLAESVTEMITPTTGELKTGFTTGNAWGLGWCIVRNPDGVTKMLSPGTFGHGGAYGTQGWVDPQTKTIYVLMIQRAGLPNSDGSMIRLAFQQVASEQLPARE